MLAEGSSGNYVEIWSVWLLQRHVLSALQMASPGGSVGAFNEGTPSKTRHRLLLIYEQVFLFFSVKSGQVQVTCYR